jgi:hypothetical protein
MNHTRFPRLFLILLLLMSLTAWQACVSIASFDQYAYAQTTSVKVDALNVMDLASDEYSLHQAEVQELRTRLLKVYEYERNRPKNELTIRLWDKILATDGHLLGGFLVRWEKEKKLGAAFIREEKKLVGSAFDQIAGLESKKLNPGDVKE